MSFIAHDIRLLYRMLSAISVFYYCQGTPGLSRSSLRKTTTPSIAELERSIDDLKADLHSLDRSLQENYKKSEIFLGKDRSYREQADVVLRFVWFL